MADLTQELSIDTDWIEISAPLTLADNARIILSVNDGHNGDSAYLAETDSADPAPTVRGHLIARFNGRPDVPVRYRKRAASFIWVRTRNAPATLVVSPSSAP